MSTDTAKPQARTEIVSTRITPAEKLDLEMLAIARHTSVAELLRPRVEELVHQATVLREKLQATA